MYYAPDGSASSINEFPVIDNVAETKNLDSKTAWELLTDWVNADDGYNNGSIKTDPKTNITYYISPSGKQIPISEFGVDESTVQNALGKSSSTGELSLAKFSDNDAPLTGRIDNDPDGNGTGTYYAPDGTGMTMEDLGKDAGSAVSTANTKKGSIPAGSMDTDPTVNANSTYQISPSMNMVTISETDESVADNSGAVDAQDLRRADENTTRENVVKIAQAEADTEGHNMGGGKYRDFVSGKTNTSLYDGEWCVTFAVYCLDKAGVKDYAKGTAQSTILRDYYKKKDEWQNAGSDYVPKPGDVIFLEWDNDPEDVDHVAIVKDVKDGKITFINGNWKGGKGIVAEEKYNLNDKRIRGYGLPIS